MILLMCINEFAPTRKQVPGKNKQNAWDSHTADENEVSPVPDELDDLHYHNNFLRSLCSQVRTVNGMGLLMTSYAKFVQTIQSAAPPVNPNVQATTTAPQKATNPPAPTVTKKVSDQTVKAVQEKLEKDKCSAGKPDGILGPATKAALSCYQEEHGLKQTGVPDADTLKALDLPPATR
jgi:murein L,D-transpeptidase YcbB/YkuD